MPAASSKKLATLLKSTISKSALLQDVSWHRIVQYRRQSNNPFRILDHRLIQLRDSGLTNQTFRLLMVLSLGGDYELRTIPPIPRDELATGNEIPSGRPIESWL